MLSWNLFLCLIFQFGPVTGSTLVGLVGFDWSATLFASCPVFMGFLVIILHSCGIIPSFPHDESSEIPIPTTEFPSPIKTAFSDPISRQLSSSLLQFEHQASSDSIVPFVLDAEPDGFRIFVHANIVDAWFFWTMNNDSNFLNEMNGNVKEGEKWCNFFPYFCWCSELRIRINHPHTFHHFNQSQSFLHSKNH